MKKELSNVEDNHQQDKEFKPFINAKKQLPEFTMTSVLLGILLAVIFGAANAYLGLRVGMTVSASIPAAVISMGVIRLVLKKDSILENNMVQTIGSAGESVAAGAIFTIPALFLWAQEWNEKNPSLLEIMLIAFIGGCLGILFMVPLRKALIVKEHETLPYPEGKACSEVLLAGEEGGTKASTVFWGLGVSAIYKWLADGFGLFPSQIHYEGETYGYKGSGVGIEVLPALVSVGYICGAKISAYMFSGGILGWLVLMPLFSLFGGNHILFPGDIPIDSMSSMKIWENYIKYIGAGAVAAGGIISLIKTLPLIGKTFQKAIQDYRNYEKSESTLRTDRDISIKNILIYVMILALAMWLLPVIPVNLVGAILIIVFGFLFATVSARLVGLVGSSNNPVSGMTIATLLIVAIFLKSIGQGNRSGMIVAIVIGSIICIITAIAGDTSQDLKTGYILGATPKKQQYGEIIGVLASSVAIGGVLYLLNAAWGYGSNELPAPQATLMKIIVEGVMESNLPWTLVFAGAFIAIVIEVVGIPVLPFAVGLYLPLHLSTGIMVGGVVRFFFEKKKRDVERGILYSSGMIAGEGLVGILLAILAVIPFGKGVLMDVLNLSNRVYFGTIGAFVCFLLLIGSMIWYTRKH